MAAAMLTLVMVLRVAYAFRYRVDSDEPQHLHVVWGWTQGLLHYRDLFDNHSPLFQMLCAPLMAALGEHSWIVAPMRLAMLPLYLADLWLVYLIGRSLYTARWGMWMALIAGCVPGFFLVTTEFRTDDLWTTLWLAIVWLAISEPLRGRRALFFGLAVGTCFAVSMKTTLMMLSMGTAALVIIGLNAASRRKTDAGLISKNLLMILLGMLIVPALLIGFFAAHGALHQMYYCVIEHNAVPGLGKWAKAGVHQWLFPLALPVMVGLGWLCMHSSANARVGTGRTLILITCAAYYFLLRSYWPLVTAQDFIPNWPLGALVVTPFVFHVLTLALRNRENAVRSIIPVASMLAVAVELAFVWRAQSPFIDGMAPFEQNLAVVLQLTKPTDLVMDGKGETIFRKRPIYWVLEGITLTRIELGLIPDDVRQSIINSGTCVVQNHRLRKATQDWVRQNYLQGACKVWVAGKGLGLASQKRLKFHTEVPGKYSIVCEKGKLEGSIDGAPLAASQEVKPGDHEFDVSAGSGQVALVWTQGLERGFSPFSKTMGGSSEQAD